jgi:ABC-type amino acid transport substrate-binding protein
MRKIVEFNKRKYFGFGSVDLDALNNQLDEISKDGWELLSINSNTWFNGFVASYTLLIECK